MKENLVCAVKNQVFSINFTPEMNDERVLEGAYIGIDRGPAMAIMNVFSSKCNLVIKVVRK